MAHLYSDLDISLDGIDVDRLSFSFPSSPTHPSRRSMDGSKARSRAENGLGSLADELAGILDYDDEDEYSDEEGDYEEGGVLGEELDGTDESEAEEDEEEDHEDGGGGKGGEEGTNGEEDEEEAHDQVYMNGDGVLALNGILANGHAADGRPRNGSIKLNGHGRTKSRATILSSPPKSRRRSSHVSHGALTLQDNSDDEILADLQDGISRGLQEQLDHVEKLAVAGRRMRFRKNSFSDSNTNGFHEHGQPRIYHHGEPMDLKDDADVIARVMDGLEKLQPQATMESGVTRLAKSHSVLAQHIFIQSWNLRDLALSLYPSSACMLPEDTAEVLESLIELIPRSTLQSLEELSGLRAMTSELISHLAFISDTLHMTRQSSISASRKLRVAREACAEWKSELEAAEKSRRWIEEGGWDGKIRRREAARVCGEVTAGFETVCMGYEQKMQAMISF